MLKAEELKTLSVLYVEDDVLGKKELAKFLKKVVGTIYTAANGEAGVELFKEHRPDMVITDVRMPLMDGLEMAKAIKKIDPKVPVMVTSAFSDAELLLQAIDVGIDGYILKPIDIDVLKKSLLKSATPLFQSRETKQKVAELKESQKALLNMMQDMQQGEEALKKASQEWRNTFDSMSDFVSVFDTNFKFVRVNKILADFMGMKPEEMIGKDLCELFCGSEPSPDCLCVRTNELKKTLTEEIDYPKIDVSLMVTISPVLNEKGGMTGFVHIAKDITEMKEARQKLIKSEEELKERVKELENFYDMAVDRELKMKELKKEIKGLKDETG